MDVDRSPASHSFDVERRRRTALSTVDEAFVEDFVFEGAKFVYRKHLQAASRIEEVEADLAAMRNWIPY